MQLARVQHDDVTRRRLDLPMTLHERCAPEVMMPMPY